MTDYNGCGQCPPLTVHYSLNKRVRVKPVHNYSLFIINYSLNKTNGTTDFSAVPPFYLKATYL